MDILKSSKLILSFTIILSFCKDPKQFTHIHNHEEISIKNWNIKQTPIEKAILYCYSDKLDFKNLEKSVKATKILDFYKDYKSTSLKFDSLPVIDTGKNYRLIINDSIIYDIMNIKTEKMVNKHGPNRIYTIYNMIKSMNINGKEYKFDKAGIFFIPKDTYIIEK